MKIPCSRSAAFLTVVLAFLCAVGLAPASARSPVGHQDAVRPLPENWEARAALKDLIFSSVRDAAAAPRRVLHQTEEPGDVLFQADVQDGAVYLVFTNRSGRGFPMASAGTFIIKRSLKDGRFLHAKVFVQDDADSFLHLFPRGDRTVMDIVLYNVEYQTQVVLPIRFEELLTSPFSRIMDVSDTSVDWSLVLPPEQGTGDIRVADVVSALRARLARLRDMDDGAMDSSGRLVYIATGDPASAGRGGFNCSGFAKWVVDGFYAPLAGRLTDIAELKSRDSDELGKAWSARYEEEQDPYFGLDWSRGLARALAREQTGAMPGPSSLDVRDADRVPWLKDVGYPVESLRGLLYFEAREHPGTIYLGSVNATARAAPAGSSLLLRQHHHVVVLFPYFDADGSFRLVTMERNKETSPASLARRYPGEYVNLVRIDAEGQFSPPEQRVVPQDEIGPKAR